MAAVGIKEKISTVLEKINGLLAKVRGGFKAVFTMALSIFSGIKTKSLKSKNKSAGRSAAMKNPVEKKSATGKLRGIVEAKIDFLTGRFMGRFPEGKRRPMLFTFGCLCVLILVLLISVIASNYGKANKAVATDKIAGIPQEELFSPTEPDFLPNFILEREPRNYWAVEDIRSFWKIPSDTGFWRREIKNTVDKLMEGVP